MTRARRPAAWERLQHLAVNLTEARALDAGPVRVHRQGEDAIGDESQRLRPQIAQSDRKQRGHHDQHRREGDLQHEEDLERRAAG